jgi:hypothetical protein
MTRQECDPLLMARNVFDLDKEHSVGERETDVYPERARDERRPKEDDHPEKCRSLMITYILERQRRLAVL